MTITLDLPDELIARLKETAERNHVNMDVIARDGIEHALFRASSNKPTMRDTRSLEKAHEILRKIGFIPPTDEEIERLKEERIFKKFGFTASTDGNAT